MTMKAKVGFESGSILEDPNVSLSGSAAISTEAKRQGDYSLKILSYPSSFGYYMKLNCTSATEYFLQFAYYVTGNSTNSLQILRWRNGSTVLGGLMLNYTTGQIDVYNGSFSSLVGSFPYTIGAWQVIELHLKMATSGGQIQARKDMGPLAVNFSGNTGSSGIDNLQWGNAYGPSVYIDDIILNNTAGSANNSWPGGLRIIRLVPTGDGGTLQFTPTPSGDHYSTVDEVPPSATDNLVASSVGLVDVFNLADCPGDVFSVAAVEPVAFGIKGSSNPPTRLALGLRLNGSDYYSSDLDLAVSQAAARNLLELNPDTGSPFTPAELNAAQLLLKSAA